MRLDLLIRLHQNWLDPKSRNDMNKILSEMASDPHKEGHEALEHFLLRMESGNPDTQSFFQGVMLGFVLAAATENNEFNTCLENGVVELEKTNVRDPNPTLN